MSQLPEKVEKKLLVVRSDILEKLYEIARKENKTLFALTNEILQDAIKVNEINKTIGELLNFHNLIKLQKDSGAMIVPSDILLKALKNWNNKEEMIKAWELAGEWYGKYLIAKLENPLEVLPSLFSTSFWHLSEIKMNMRNDDKVFISLIAPNTEQILIEITVGYVNGIMSALGFQNTKCDIIRGVAILEFSKKI